MSTSGIEFELGDDSAASREDQLRALVGDLRRAQRRAAEAGEAERRRIEQNLHDGAQQRLISLRIEFGLLAEIIETKPAQAVARLAELRSEFDEALDELRELAHGLYPPVLASDGLLTALKAMTRHAAIPITLESIGLKRVSAPVESAAYFCCVEAVQNATKHGGDSVRVDIRLWMGDRVLRFAISDDGRGFDLRTTGRHHGMTNLVDRIAALGGHLKINSIPGQGTTVSGEIPLA